MKTTWLFAVALTACDHDKVVPAVDTGDTGHTPPEHYPIECSTGLHYFHNSLPFSVWRAEGTLVPSDRNASPNIVSRGAFDLNGDGHDDLAVGSTAASSLGPDGPYATWDDDDHHNQGAVYVIDNEQALACTHLDDAPARIFNHVNDDYFGSTIIGLPDIDEDGYDELLVAAARAPVNPYAAPDDGGMEAGSTNHGAYLFHGPITGPVDTATADATLMLPIQPDASYDTRLGQDIASIGDINLDGQPEFAISAINYRTPSDSSGHGAIFLLHDSTTGTVDVAEEGIQLTAPVDARELGTTIVGNQDINGDGLVDLITSYESPSAPSPVIAVLYGPVTASASIDDRADARISMTTYSLTMGYPMSAAGDLDADGYDDFLVSSVHDSTVDIEGTGAVYVVHGPVVDGLYDTEVEGKIVCTRAYQDFGISLSGNGDVDGDGTPDFIIGAPTIEDAPAAETFERGAGVAWLVTRPVVGVERVRDVGFAIPGDREGGYHSRIAQSVALGGDYDEDGLTDVLISDSISTSPVRVQSEYRAKAVHVFSGATLLDAMIDQGW